jgi:hypothetical protein
MQIVASNDNETLVDRGFNEFLELGVGGGPKVQRRGGRK